MSDALAATSQQTLTATTPDGPIVGSVQGTGAPLLLLHGGPAISDYMELLAPELAGWRWVSYQQRGLAPSAVDGPFTVERHVADAVAVLDEAGLDRAMVLGHSWGGFLALNLALAHPERVTGLVIVDPLGAVGDGGVAEMGQVLGSRLLPAAVEKYGEIAAKLATEPTDDAMLESLKLLWPGYYADPPSAPPLPEFMRASVAAYAGTFRSVAELQAGGLAERLGAIELPAVFVLGEKSPMPVSQGEATAARLSRSEVHLVPAAGHLPWHEQPGCVAAALARVSELTGVS
jgi:proline iminopeptidase